MLIAPFKLLCPSVKKQLVTLVYINKMKYYSLFLLLSVATSVNILQPKELIAIESVLEYRPQHGRGPLPFEPSNHTYGPHRGKRSWVHVADSDYVNSTAYIGEAPKSYHRTVLNSSSIGRSSSSNEASSSTDESSQSTNEASSNTNSSANESTSSNETSTTGETTNNTDSVGNDT